MEDIESNININNIDQVFRFDDSIHYSEENAVKPIVKLPINFINFAIFKGGIDFDQMTKKFWNIKKQILKILYFLISFSFVK